MLPEVAATGNLHDGVICQLLMLYQCTCQGLYMFHLYLYNIVVEGQIKV